MSVSEEASRTAPTANATCRDTSHGEERLWIHISNQLDFALVVPGSELTNNCESILSVRIPVPGDWHV